MSQPRAELSQDRCHFCFFCLLGVELFDELFSIDQPELRDAKDLPVDTEQPCIRSLEQKKM